jgi:uncharacterized protein YecE (DUF72 family)
MRYFIGTSGYSYKEWKGSFYPEKFSDKKMLSFYAERFSSVEINCTFRQIPSPSTIANWAAQVPINFRFVCKAPQSITHHKKLQNAEEETKRFFEALSGLEMRQGPVLFQLPPTFKKDLPRLENFLVSFKGKQAAMEFRHQSWFDDEVFDCLRQYACGLCVSDGDEYPVTELVKTTHWGYVRLRREDYTDAELRKWIKKFESPGWKEMYVFFRHEDIGTGPKLAVRLMKLLGIKGKTLGEDGESQKLLQE